MNNSRITFRWLQSIFLVFSTLVVANVSGEVIELGSAQEFKDLITAGELDLILDVRTAGEWAGGHIEDATFVDSLSAQLSSSNDDEALLRSLNVWNCRHCRVAVYCGSGVRAGSAADRLLQAGFDGTLYNALGVGQWTNAGYPLVNTASKEDWPCMMADDAVISRQGGAGVCPSNNLVVGYDQHQMELDAARDLFMAQMEVRNATAYSFNYTRSCFCPPADYPWRVTAEIQQLMIGVKPNFTEDVIPLMLVDPTHVAHTTHDVVTSAITSTGADVVARQQDTYSILDLFDKIQEAIDKEASDIQVVYHKDWGYPEDIAIDYTLEIADEEWYSTATDFDYLAIAPSMLETEDEDDEAQVQAVIGVDEEAAAEPPAQWAKNFGW